MSLKALTQATKLSITTNTNTEQLSRIASYLAMTLVGIGFFASQVIAKNEAIALTRANHLVFEVIALTRAVKLILKVIARTRVT